MDQTSQIGVTPTPKKGNLGWIIPIVALSLACIGMGGYIVVSSINGNNNQASESSKAQTEQNDSASSANSENASISSAQKPVVVDVSRALNTDGYTYTQYYQFFAGITTNVNGKELIVKYSPENLCEYYYLECQQAISNVYSNTLQFDQPIADVFYGGFGQNGPFTDTIFILLKDGTVEYIPLVLAAKTSTGDPEHPYDFRSYGKLEGVSDVVKFSMATVDDGFSGYGTTLAIKSDGSFYDLSSILEATGSY